VAIHYAQCWEDPQTLSEALAVTPDDDVISIASGGDNTLALLLLNPHTLTAVDHNSEQLAVLKLKLLAIAQFDYDDFVAFIGAAPCANRITLYRQLRGGLDSPDRDYWDHRAELLNKGVIHCGRFERYFAQFRRWVLPLVHSRRIAQRLLSLSSVNEQKEFYDDVWNNRRWRFLFRLFFCEFLLGRLGRSPAFFRYVKERRIADLLLARTRRGLTEIPIVENYFVHYILTGAYSKLDTTHPYLQKANFRSLQENVGRLRLVQAGLVEYLKTLPTQSISRFNLSDVFEYLSTDAFEEIAREIARVGRSGSRVAFWTLFIPRPLPPSLASRFLSEAALAQKLYACDRAFYYGDFNLWRLKALEGDAERGRGVHHPSMSNATV
jgi:S-adenosylmethionine-diacylglycerol 3-amino-3-carboxypropyl transferase